MHKPSLILSIQLSILLGAENWSDIFSLLLVFVLALKISTRLPAYRHISNSHTLIPTYTLPCMQIDPN